VVSPLQRPQLDTAHGYGMIIVRYADDYIVGFEHESDARHLPE
jgi:hypothetical protein